MVTLLGDHEAVRGTWSRNGKARLGGQAVTMPPSIHRFSCDRPLESMRWRVRRKEESVRQASYSRPADAKCHGLLVKP